MKKLISVLLTAIISLSLLAFGACSQGDGKTYDINEYFQSSNAPHDLARFIGSEEPTAPVDRDRDYSNVLFLKAKKDVKIKKISGTAYYNYEWWNDVCQELADLKMPLPDSKITTMYLVENVELTKNVPTHFDFVMTKESADFPDVLKTGKSIDFAVHKSLGSFVAIRNLKVEFEPA